MTVYDLYRTWASELLPDVPRVSVIVPAFNEEWRILPTVGAIAHHMAARGEPFEIVVADDGSTDTTVELLLGLELVNLRVLVTDRNRGKGSAVRRGMQAARGSLLLFADADQSTPIEQLDALVARIDAGNDVAIGSRAASGAAVRNKRLVRRVLSRGLRAAVRVGTGLRLTDTQCGFKLFTADAARTLFGTQRVDGFSFDLEVLYLARKLGLSVAEVPVEWIDAPGSTVDSAAVTASFLRELARIRLADLRGTYDRLPPTERSAELDTSALPPAPYPDRPTVATSPEGAP